MEKLPHEVIVELKSCIRRLQAELGYVKQFLPLDENGCHTSPTGECISLGPCIHTDEKLDY